MSVVFDKLAFVRRLESEGAFSRGQAEALGEALHQAVNETVATKSDLAEVRHEIRELRMQVGHEISEFRAQVSHELSEFRAQGTHGLRELRAKLKLWSGSLAAALFAALGSLMAALRFFGH